MPHITTDDLSEAYKLSRSFAPYRHTTDGERMALICNINGEDVVPVFETSEQCEKWIDENLIYPSYRPDANPHLRRLSYGITSHQIGGNGLNHIDTIGFAWIR